MSWLEKLLPSKIQQTDPTVRRQMPEGLAGQMPQLRNGALQGRSGAEPVRLPWCSHHHRIGARARHDAFLDPEGRYEIGPGSHFRSMRSSSRTAASIPNVCALSPGKYRRDRCAHRHGWRAVRASTSFAACFEFDFMGGSMGSVVGERFVRAGETAIERRCLSSALPLPAVRVWEGLLSLSR